MNSQFICFYFSRPPNISCQGLSRRSRTTLLHFRTVQLLACRRSGHAGHPGNQFANRWPKRDPPYLLIWLLVLFALTVVCGRGKTRYNLYTARRETSFLLPSKLPTHLVFSKKSFLFFFPYFVQYDLLRFAAVHKYRTMLCTLDQLQRELFLKCLRTPSTGS